MTTVQEMQAELTRDLAARNYYAAEAGAPSGAPPAEWGVLTHVRVDHIEGGYDFRFVAGPGASALDRAIEDIAAEIVARLFPGLTAPHQVFVDPAIDFPAEWIEKIEDEAAKFLEDQR